MNYFDEFCNEFKPLLTAKSYKQGEFSRWSAFEFIADQLFLKNRPIKIIETGTLRKNDDWLGYGHSTILWDFIVSKTGGIAKSVDIDLDMIRFARSICKNITFIHCDSVGFLRGTDVLDVDLLYLDSYDWSKNDHISSCLHHITELGCVWDRLPKGCLIAVDDCHSRTEGKHVLVHQFFKEILKQEPIINCHVQVWRKL